MPRPRRRFVRISVVVLLCIVVGIGANVLWGVKRAADDVGAMLEPTVVIPKNITVLPEPGEQPAPVVESAEPTALPVPTNVPAPNAPLTILLMGTDARIGEDVARTDSMIVLHIDPVARRVSTLSLPRDLNTTIPYVNRRMGINTAYYLGEKRLGKGYGAALAKETVSNLLGIPIDYAVLINFDGFTKLVDKLGGITVNVPKVIDDNKYPMDEYAGDVRTMSIHFDTGIQTMDGKTALIYSRTRHADSDFGRQARQQQVLVAIFNKIRAENLYSQITSFDDYTAALRSSVRMDLSRQEILSLASLVPSVDVSAVEHYSVKPAMLSEQQNPYFLFINDKKAFKNLVSTFVNGEVTAVKPAQ